MNAGKRSLRVLAGSGGSRQEAILVRSQLLKNEAYKKRSAASRQWLKEWLQRVDSWPNGVTCYGVGPGRGDQVASDIVAEIRKIVAWEA